MKYILFLVAFIFSVGVGAQQTPLSYEETKRLSDFEGIQVDFRYDEIWRSYIYTTQSIIKSATDALNPQVKITAYLKLTAVDDAYCFSDLYFGFNLFLQGIGFQYDSVAVAIGFTSNIRKGDAINYGFSVQSDAKGNATVGGEQLEEILLTSIDMKRPLNFTFYAEGKLITTAIIAYAKVGQKFGGIIKTRDNLAKKYVLCEE
jgi:hypothetical protein